MNNLGKFNRSNRPTRKLPADLFPRIPRFGGSGSSGLPGNNVDPLMQHLSDNSDIVVNTLVVEQGLIGTQYIIGTTPVQVVDGKRARGYILLNPTAPVGLTSSSTILGSAARTGSGNTQASPLGVASYDRMSLFLDISASGGGTIQIDTLTQDPISLNWATSQLDIFGLPSAVGTYYANVGTVGVDSAFAVVWTISAGTSTFSLGATLKDGLAGGGSGLANTIFLGGPNVSSSSGLPLQEGKTEKLFFKQNVKLYAVSLISGGINLNVLALQ